MLIIHSLLGINEPLEPLNELPNLWHNVPKLIVIITELNTNIPINIKLWERSFAMLPIIVICSLNWVKQVVHVSLIQIKNKNIKNNFGKTARTGLNISKKKQVPSYETRGS